MFEIKVTGRTLSGFDEIAFISRYCNYSGHFGINSLYAFQKRNNQKACSWSTLVQDFR